MFIQSRILREMCPQILSSQSLCAISFPLYLLNVITCPKCQFNTLYFYLFSGNKAHFKNRKVVKKNGGAYNDRPMFRFTSYICLAEERHCQRQGDPVSKNETLLSFVVADTAQNKLRSRKIKLKKKAMIGIRLTMERGQ